MNRCVVLDAEAMSALAGQPSRRKDEVRAALQIAHRLGRDVIVPAVVLAELYRGRHQNQLIDACLSRETGLAIQVTDRAMARLVGAVLAAAKADSTLLADAHVIATAVDRGGGIALTGDTKDLERLAAAFRSVNVVSLET